MTWIRLISRRDAEGPLREAYEQVMRPLPAAYRPAHGDAPGLIRAHSLDAKLMTTVFGGISWAIIVDGTLTWRERELVNTAASLANQCFY